MLALPLAADVRLPALFSDNMMLQHEMPLRVWGWAEPGEAVTVSIADQTVTATADADGTWRLKLKPMKAGGPFEMTVKGKNTITIKNILIGEVWLASGQSNMEMSVGGCDNLDYETNHADYPGIRYFSFNNKIRYQPTNDVKGNWIVCRSDTVRGFSATAYFYARTLHTNLGVPVGILRSTWGGTPAEAWMPIETLAASSEFYELTNGLTSAMAKYPNPDAVTNTKEIIQLRMTTTTLFNGMIAPLTNYVMRGAIWYQGENNAGPRSRAKQYRRLLPLLITSWRERWDIGDFPFYLVQLANYQAKSTEPGESGWADLRESQTAVLAVTNTGMAVIIDIGNTTNIHPKDKQTVGYRLALPALAKTYGVSGIVYSGPQYRSMKVDGSTVRLSFDHIDGGLIASNAIAGSMPGFAIAGKDKKFVWAKAVIDGARVVVSSEKVPVPAAVRYAWASNPDVGLYNRAGLPATPFRTDDWASYQASDGYADRQGRKGWHFLSFDGTNYSEMKYTNGRWEGTEPYCHVYQNAQHPGNTAGSVRKWTAPKNGTLRIMGSARSTGTVKGISLTIMKNAEKIWTDDILPDKKSEAVVHEVTAAVAAGDAVCFIVQAIDNNNSNDYTMWDPSIEYVE